MPAYKICVNLFAVQAHGAVYNIYILGGPPASHIGLTIFHPQTAWSTREGICV